MEKYPCFKPKTIADTKGADADVNVTLTSFNTKNATISET